MRPNEVFKEVSFDNYQNIKQHIKEKFQINPNQPKSNFIADIFEINTNEGKITFTYYKKNKLLVQSSPTNKDFINIVKEISEILSVDPEKQLNSISLSLEKDNLDFDYYIGCDEAGKGETFGSLYLGCALIKKVMNISNIMIFMKSMIILN